ncbi:MAG: terminase large subunit domain-containing protein [Dermatophilaceae bacterium]
MAKGRPLMPWQRRAVDVALEVDPGTGLPVYGIVVVTVPRQAGKTKLIGDLADTMCLVRPRQRVWYTAQTGKDASRWMRDEHFPSLHTPVFGVPGRAGCRYRISRRAGAEGVDWSNGSSFRVFPPMRDALHGAQSDLVFVDEAWAIAPEQGSDLRQAITPTMATRPHSQLWLVSTMGDALSTWWQGYVDLARDVLDRQAEVALIDYGLRDDDDANDLAVVASRHPAVGHTISVRSLETARSSFTDDPAGWARAYGNRATGTRVAIWPDGVWDAAGVAHPGYTGQSVTLGIDVDPSLTTATIVASWVTDDITYVDILDHGPYAERAFAARLADLCQDGQTVVADRGSVGAMRVMDVLARDHRHVKQLLTTLSQYASATAEFVRGVTDGTVRHMIDPDLTDAASSAAYRHVSDGATVWGRTASAGPITPLVAATLASYGARSVRMSSYCRMVIV